MFFASEFWFAVIPGFMVPAPGSVLLVHIRHTLAAWQAIWKYYNPAHSNVAKSSLKHRVEGEDIKKGSRDVINEEKDGFVDVMIAQRFSLVGSLGTASIG